MTEVFAKGDAVVVTVDNARLRKGWRCTVKEIIGPRAIMVSYGGKLFAVSPETITRNGDTVEDDGVDKEKIEGLCETMAMIFSDHQKRGGSLHPFMVAALTLAALPEDMTDAERIELARLFRNTHTSMKKREADRD